MPRLLDRVNEATRPLHHEADADLHALLADGVTGDHYRRYLMRVYGFIFPLEQSLAETPGIEDRIDLRRLRKHLLLEHDLGALGVRAQALAALPQCMSIPMFDAAPQALGWAYFVERMTLGHPNLFRHLASVLPGDVAFASSYLKCYFGALGDMWSSFGGALDAAAETAEHEREIVAAARTSFEHYRRWRMMLEDDGKAAEAAEARQLCDS